MVLSNVWNCEFLSIPSFIKFRLLLSQGLIYFCTCLIYYFYYYIYSGLVKVAKNKESSSSENLFDLIEFSLCVCNQYSKSPHLFTVASIYFSYSLQPPAHSGGRVQALTTFKLTSTFLHLADAKVTISTFVYRV